MIILTGGAGFIGSAVLEKLNSQGLKDIIVVDNLGSSEKWKNLSKKTYLNYLHKSELIPLLEKNSLSKIDAIIHLGACSSTTETDANYVMANNYQYTLSLAKHALENNIRFIYASSAATYGDGSLGFDDDPEKLAQLEPLNIYGYSKHAFDIWARESSALNNIVGLKFFNVYGPNEYHKENMSSVLYKAFHQIKENGELKLFKSNHPDFGDGGQKRDFIYVKDCSNCIYWLLNNKVSGLYNLGTGNARSWNDLANAAFSALKLDANIKYIDMPENLKGKYQNFTEAKMSRLKNAGYNEGFYSLEDGAKDYINNYLEQDIKIL